MPILDFGDFLFEPGDPRQVPRLISINQALFVQQTKNQVNILLQD